MKKHSVLLFRWTALLLACLLSLFSLSSCALLSYLPGGNEGRSEKIDDGFDKLKLIVNLIKVNSYYEIDDEMIYASLLDGFYYVAGDRYAEYYSAEDYAALTAENSGDAQGIGIQVIESKDYDCIQVISVMPDSPALEAGVRVGDLITHIGVGEDAVPVSDFGYTMAVKQLQGAAGTVAKFTVFRGENYAEKVEFEILRAKYTSQSVMYRVCATDAKVGIVKLLQFDLTTPGQFCEAMDALIASGCEKFVFDLRYNGGGDLASVSAVLSYFLNRDDIIVRTRNRAGDEDTRYVDVVNYPASSGYAPCSVTREDIGKYREAVLGKSAVIVNGSTASAAELFTASLRDYGISRIVGTQTFGKGSMQSIIPLSNYGSDGALKLTTKMYFPPLSDGYDGVGITPDAVVELNDALAEKNIYLITDGEDNQLAAAISEIGR